MSDMITLKHIDLLFGKGTVNEVRLFNDFNFSLQKGQFVSVVGSNGSGKTTLLNLICGTLQPDKGDILLNGSPITKLPEHERMKNIGRVFQDPLKGTCGNLTILENMSLADSKGKFFGLSHAVSRAKLDKYRANLESLKLGLEDKLNSKVGALSSGQRQALALLLVSMTPVDLLILDEHTAALDPNSSETVMELTDKIIKEKQLTALMVTHNLRYAVQYGDRLVMMHEGGTVKDVAAEEKRATTVEDLLGIFNAISIECGN